MRDAKWSGNDFKGAGELQHGSVGQEIAAGARVAGCEGQSATAVSVRRGGVSAWQGRAQERDCVAGGAFVAGAARVLERAMVGLVCVGVGAGVGAGIGAVV